MRPTPSRLPPTEQATATMTHPSARPCLLIIDDDSDVRAMLQAALCEDYTVFCLPNGDNVLAQLDLARPRLLIVGVNAPGSTGYEASEAVRAQARHDRLPILFMTAKLDGSRFVELGEDACIGMPFEMRQLRRCIEFLLSKGEKK